MFVSFEGIDFSGKTTQIKKLINYFEQSNQKYCLVREPGGTQVSEQIRNILLDKKNINLLPETELLLFSAARAQLVRELIKPKLLEGYVVIADRFYHSTIAYQGYGRGIDLKSVETITKFAVGDTIPDLVFILDIDYETSQKRANLCNERTKDRIEVSEKEFYNKVREGYIHLAKQEKNCILIDATINENEIFEIILSKIQEW
ncbi:MAG TPA: dTMP kinase [Ignavibacteriales bacterium]|nr:dTMP kinase [Ignavibacteriales bacterium]HPD67757.1 dTMP kinase [Ignavibacteriales bacterium]HRR18533.1 dTMP kinase [Ignavibacteriales bacterium]